MKRLKMLTIFIITFIIIFVPANPSYAFSDLIASADDFISAGEAATTTGSGTLEQTSVETMSDNILSVLVPLGVIVAVLVGVYLGIKFMVGSAEEQAKVKETLIPYVVGCIVIFGAFGIWKLVIEVLRNTVG